MQRLELVKRNSKTLIINICHTFRMLSRDIEDVKKTQKELQEKKATNDEMENSYMGLRTD